MALTAIEDAKYMCVRQHGDAPEVTLHGRLDLTFAYVSEHVHYILLELLKNSMRYAPTHTHTYSRVGRPCVCRSPLTLRLPLSLPCLSVVNRTSATVEFHGTDKMPPIRIVIADGEDNEDVVIKVSDEGGGIPRSHIMRIWSYLFTTADPAIQQVSAWRSFLGPSRLPACLLV